MTGLLGRYTERQVAGLPAPIARRPGKKPALPIVDSGPIRGPLSTVAMAIGYLGLVTILTMAPFLHQTMMPDHSQPLACTDFGGSR